MTSHEYWQSWIDWANTAAATTRRQLLSIEKAVEYLQSCERSDAAVDENSKEK